jgi:hypothetical protein
MTAENQAAAKQTFDFTCHDNEKIFERGARQTRSGCDS